MGALTPDDVNAERLVVLGWPRAILLQLAHPLVAAGVGRHSTLERGGLSPILRLHHTVSAMLAISFGTSADRERAIAGICAIHRRVRGTLSAAVGPFPAGTVYSAEDPALVLWVHATLLDSIAIAYEAFVAPLAQPVRDRLCEDSADVAIAIGAEPAAVPRTWAALQTYLQDTYRSGVIVVGDDARRVGRVVLEPWGPRLTWPVIGSLSRVTIGWLPDDVRAGYGFAWTAADERRAARVIRRLRGVRWALPRALALWAPARAAARQRGTPAQR